MLRCTFISTPTDATLCCTTVELIQAVNVTRDAATYGFNQGKVELCQRPISNGVILISKSIAVNIINIIYMILLPQFKQISTFEKVIIYAYNEYHALVWAENVRKIRLLYYTLS